MGLTLEIEIEECHDCPRLKIREVRHWLLGYHPGYEYKCTKINKTISPSEGVKPPPKWCPLREENKDGKR